MKVFLGLPRYKSVPRQAEFGPTQADMAKPFRESACQCPVIGRYEVGSMLTRGFTRLLRDALNMRDQGVTHFAMQHDDIFPKKQWWIDKLYGIMVVTGADVVSCVVPLKEGTGVTSTGVRWSMGKFQRFTMRDLAEMPITFSAGSLGYPEGAMLLMNTGLWLMDITKPWITEPTPLSFNVYNEMKIGENGKLEDFSITEDWLFGIKAAQRGAMVICTREVELVHVNLSVEAEIERKTNPKYGVYPNYGVWGEWDHDKEYVA